MRDELLHLHRDSLEARLAAEETLAALAGLAAPAGCRAHWPTRASGWPIIGGWQPAESPTSAALAKFGQEIAAQSKNLAARKEDLGRWAQRRQQEFDEQAAALAQREEELRELQSQMGLERAEWEQSRLAFEQQLRGRMAQTSRGDRLKAGKPVAVETYSRSGEHLQTVAIAI